MGSDNNNNNNNVINRKDYILLKDFRKEIEVENEKNFSISFWVYLINSSTAAFPATIIKQVCSDISSNAPFLVLNEKKKMTLFPFLHAHKDTTNFSNSTSMEIEFPLENWIHVGCEVVTDMLRLHINGEIVGEQPQSFSLDKSLNSNGLRKITLAGAGVDDGLQGYIHLAEVLPLSFSIKDHYVKDPPLRLSVDLSSTSEIDEDSDSIWNIVGGKASCRRIFSLDVVLLNAICQAVNKELEIVASLVYADSGLHVEKTSDDEDPLLASCDGIEFASYDRPGKLLHGRASLKLKISQLSSKCDNRLFRIKLEIPKFSGYHFLEAFSHPIRCISRCRNPRTSMTWKRPSSAPDPSNKSQSFGLYVACYSDTRTTNQVANAVETQLAREAENIEEADNSPSVSDSIEERLSDFNIMSSSGYLISDVIIFKYCLGGMTDRALLLKEVATSASEEDLFRLANEVSLYSGCSHHRRQIVIAKRLIEEGTKVWNSISQNNRLIQWENGVFEIEEQFMRITCSSTRSFTEQDFELLRRISGCGEYMAQENFEKIWRWLYPVAFTLTSDSINTIWNSTSPKWIEGFITKEEAEQSLQGPRGLQEPGTFVLRFPTSRSWPHSDAGCLIVTYVGSDYTIHHRLLSLDYIYSCEESEMNGKSLEDMLFAEPELSRLGRIVRQRQ
ncbi:SIGNAL TRANSDUCER AND TRANSCRIPTION ACTIVATOR [Salix purpurea]|uniref:SIGNAL TRANSDUCER AND TRANSCRIPTION ACTIVATOR n=1 Tax=Salix purpurea TaxID=77065 RepID=A0A9Q0VT61_SALPP|nr:SIGNAL TRANSDUCER AND TRANSCRIPTION ACTIVATOR [Salix purpurea]